MEAPPLPLCGKIVFPTEITCLTKTLPELSVVLQKTFKTSRRIKDWGRECRHNGLMDGNTRTPLACPFQKQGLHNKLIPFWPFGYFNYSKFLTYSEAISLSGVCHGVDSSVIPISFLFFLSFSMFNIDTLNLSSRIWLVYFLIKTHFMSWLFQISVEGHGFVIVVMISKWCRLNSARIIVSIS